MKKTPDLPSSLANAAERLERIGQLVPDDHKQLVMLRMMMKLATGAMNNRMRDLLRQQDLHTVSFTALTMLINDDGTPLNPSELSAMTGESRANITRVCDEMVARGLLNRCGNPDDRRRVDLTLAPNGRDILHALMPQVHRLILGPLAALDQDERDALERILKKLIHELDNQPVR
ncbi:MarR family transcriptional regulator [Paludibacterium paludis]|uniref:MarR family transcriptional regulator n=1 Tax=Paludibacterium paludis TaxID=1225769 RepID=A0A918U996_9NEIS|nr:MarR family transcriptional regulator [Paludibacterium paludis]GGY11186.1 MarR family transcriptional regulator [Paludibacterium paludis]